ncbi:MAG TPA: SMC family ATPase [Actinomycetota bacterium]|jgi:exonuclease SbcC
MRPVALRVKGFTAFRDEQVIDFSDLDLFALWGPTGSGKSSILDAITYALFGYVERVGREASQLVSQGQPRMAVTLDFSVGSETYRVTRSTPRSGATTARLEVLRGTEFATFGEHADQVKGVNAAIKEVLGLDYEAFTRSVILPQGKFAEFLTGEAKNRRRILTELLGLELFKRMAQRANEIGRDARVNAEAKEQFLERDYAGIDEAAVARAQSDAQEAAGAAKTLASAEKKVGALRERWEDEGRTIASLDECATEVEDVAAQLADRASALHETLAAVAPLEDDLARASEAATAAETALSTARQLLEDRTEKDGDVEQLAALGQVVIQWTKAGTAVALAQESVLRESLREKAAQDELTSATELLGKARGELEKASKELAEREAQHERAHDADKVGALVHGLAVGDPCPVCERPLERVPSIADDALDAAKKTLSSARAAKESAARAVHSAEKDVAVATQAVATARDTVERCTSESAARMTDLDEHAVELARAFGGSMPEDPGALITERLEALKKLTADVEAADKAHRATQAELTHKTKALDAAKARCAEVTAALRAMAIRPVLQRVAQAAPKLKLPVPWSDDAASDSAVLVKLATKLADDLAGLTEKLSAIRKRAEEDRSKLVDQAMATLPGGIEMDVDDMKLLAIALGELSRRTSEEAAVAGKAAADLKERLAAAESMRAEVSAHRQEHQVYKALGLELKDDRIVEFLQEEALQVLALAASARLRDLSSGRYELSFDRGEFFVVDAWNGDERRSVSTLSGGETFLASLALALALSEQIQLLAVSERNKLESLFLDEGFGTLDAESLEVVVNAIEQLGGEDRLVGVITHVPELADRLPVRLEVTKSPRGSVVSKTVGELSRVSA